MVIEKELTSDEIKSLRNLLEVEEIKNLRLRYSYFLDARQLDRGKEVFAEDAVCRFGPYGTWERVLCLTPILIHSYGSNNTLFICLCNLERITNLLSGRGRL